MHSYSLIQAFLHDLIFSQKLINKSLFQFEKFIYLKKKIYQRENIYLLLGCLDLELLYF